MRKTFLLVLCIAVSGCFGSSKKEEKSPSPLPASQIDLIALKESVASLTKIVKDGQDKEAAAEKAREADRLKAVAKKATLDELRQDILAEATALVEKKAADEKALTEKKAADEKALKALFDEWNKKDLVPPQLPKKAIDPPPKKVQGPAWFTPEMKARQDLNVASSDAWGKINAQIRTQRK